MQHPQQEQPDEHQGRDPHGGTLQRDPPTQRSTHTEGHRQTEAESYFEGMKKAIFEGMKFYNNQSREKLG